MNVYVSDFADGLDLMEHLFHGQLLLRTRCLECESFSERREDFQDISVPVQEEQPSSSDDLSSGLKKSRQGYITFPLSGNGRASV